MKSYHSESFISWTKLPCCNSSGLFMSCFDCQSPIIFFSQALVRFDDA